MHDIKVVHLTSAHPRFDTRILIKECCSLAKKYSVSLVVADGLGDEIKENVFIYDVGKFNSRKERMIYAPRVLLKKSLELDAELYHLHDPELIPIGIILKMHGKKVIFDAHEDLPNQIYSKPYLHPLIKKPVSITIRLIESLTCARLDGIIAATPFIRDKFLTINNNSIDINNYPKIEEFNNTVASKIKNQVCYVGGLAEVRGITEMVSALEITQNDSQLKIAGNFIESVLQDKITKMRGWKKVDFIGYVGRDEIKNTLIESVAGLVLLHPTRSYIDSLPVKMFEYMIAGIPVIASNFPLWESIIDEAACGICVDPLNPNAIADAIDYLINHPEKAIEMGEKGRKAVINNYNWNIEEEKLYKFYNKILEK